MSFRQNVFWYVLMIVLTILILSILSIAVFAPKPEPITIGKAEVLPLADVSAVTAITPPAQESSLVKSFIDVSNKIGKYQKLIGWIYIENQQTKNQKVYVSLEKPDGAVVYYSTMPMERPDVGAYFKNPLYNSSGFSAFIPLKDGIDINAYTIRFVVKNNNGTYKSPVRKANRG